MEYLDLCRMREVGYTRTKPHFANNWVRKPLKYTPLSVYAFRISTWSRSRGLCFQVHNSWHSLFFCWQLSISWIEGELPVFVVRPHAPNRDACTVTVRYEYMYRDTPSTAVRNSLNHGLFANTYEHHHCLSRDSVPLSGLNWWLN